MGREEVKPSEARFIAGTKALCNEQLHAQGKVDSLLLLFYNKICSFNSQLRMFSEKSSGFCLLLSSLTVTRGKS